MAPGSGKIFGIGFQKTGTSTLDVALRRLGYRALGGFRINHPKGVAIPPPVTTEKVLAVALQRAAEGDAFSDNPWPVLFREMDAAFPDARFILTHRAPERWYASVLRHFADKPSEMARWIYGVPYPMGNEALYLQIYNAHNAAVRAHFAARPGKLLEMDFEQGHGWAELCPFLGHDVPSRPFPYENPAARRERRQFSPWRRLRRALAGQT